MTIKIEEGPYVKFTVEVTVIEGDKHPNKQTKQTRKEQNGTNSWSRNKRE